MNQKELSEKVICEKLMIWLPFLSAGKTLEAVYPDGNATEVCDVADLISLIKSGDEIRVKPEQVKCKEWFACYNGEIGDFEQDVRIYRCMQSLGRSKKQIRVIEPLEWGFVREKIHAELKNCPAARYVDYIMPVLKELRMLKDDG